MNKSKTLTERSISEFTTLLASDAPTPGGGTAAAYVGAMGIALCTMCGNFTLGRERYADVQSDVREMNEDANEIRRRLMDLVEEDSAAFAPLAAVYRMSADDPARPQAIEAATKEAVTPPLEMMRELCKAVVIIEEMREKGSRTLQSDVGCAASLTRAALDAASTNVFVNTAFLKDRELATTVETECDRMLDEYLPRCEAIAEGVVAEIRSMEV